MSCNKINRIDEEKDEKTYIFKDGVALGNFVGKFTRRLFLKSSHCKWLNWRKKSLGSSHKWLSFKYKCVTKFGKTGKVNSSKFRCDISIETILADLCILEYEIVNYLKSSLKRIKRIQLWMNAYIILLLDRYMEVVILFCKLYSVNNSMGKIKSSYTIEDSEQKL